jgi:hypothetical protein
LQGHGGPLQAHQIAQFKAALAILVILQTALAELKIQAQVWAEVLLHKDKYTPNEVGPPRVVFAEDCSKIW